MKRFLDDHRFFILFPPYRELEAIDHPSDIPSSPLPPRGAALVWNLRARNWDDGFRAVGSRPGGVALLIVLPPTSRSEEMEHRLELMAHCRPHSILPHLKELDTDELIPLLKRFPADLGLEVAEYLSWRGIDSDSDTRRLIRRTLDLSEELRTVSGLARSLYLSRRALGRRFTSRGLPAPSHWLHFGRLLRASLRLQNPDCTLHSVSCELGYADGFALSNQMVRLTGLRPSIMRACFGWEWIVEAWLRQEARKGNLSQGLALRLFPLEDASTLAGQRTLKPTGTGPVEGLRVAEESAPKRTAGRSP